MLISQLVPYPGFVNSSILSTFSAGEKVKLKDDIATQLERLSKLRSDCEWSVIHTSEER